MLLVLGCRRRRRRRWLFSRNSRGGLLFFFNIFSFQWLRNPFSSEFFDLVGFGERSVEEEAVDHM